MNGKLKVLVSVDYGKRKVYWIIKRFINIWGLFPILILLVIGFQAETLASSGREYKIKAAFLLNFVKFIEWPPGAFTSSEVPVVLGILGNDPFGEAIEALGQKRVKGRAIKIKRLKDLGSATGCHILFVSNSEKDALNGIFQSLEDRAILTVGETELFAQKGGIINFITDKNKIRFEINITAADRVNLKISSKLLKLAKVIRRESD